MSEKLTISERLKKIKETGTTEDTESKVSELKPTIKESVPVSKQIEPNTKAYTSTIETRKAEVFADFKDGVIFKIRTDNFSNVYESPIHDKYIKLGINHSYKFSVTKGLNFSDSEWSSIKLAEQWRGKLEITDITDGLATVFVRFNDIRINDGDLLCELR